jgi:hypothetical protein
MEEKLPKGYKIKYILKQSPMTSDYILICEKKDEVAIVRFDGISEYPISIQTYYQSRNLTNPSELCYKNLAMAISTLDAFIARSSECIKELTEDNKDTNPKE